MRGCGAGSIEIAGPVRETGGDICVEDKEGDVQILQRLRTLGATLLLAACAASGATQAQDFPNRPIRFIVAFPAGGPTDFVARILADRMNALLGQIVLVENKPGANAAIGAAYVAKSEPDGYTLFVTTAGAFTINPNLRSDMPYDPVRDFAPVTLIVSTSPEALGELVKSDSAYWRKLIDEKGIKLAP
jgi:tripartite-type tricarboxylate transporter receptor subunit TctC